MRWRALLDRMGCADVTLSARHSFHVVCERVALPCIANAAAEKGALEQSLRKRSRSGTPAPSGGPRRGRRNRATTDQQTGQEQALNAAELGKDRAAHSFNPFLKHAGVCAALGVLILLAWSNSFSGQLVFDNRAMIVLDSRVHAATSENVGLILNHAYWATIYDVGLYRPITTLSYLLNYAILGNAERPAGYHALNICLHILNACLVYALTLRLLRKLWPAAFIAAVWSLHPIVTESVTNIVGRADLLAALGVLSGLLLYFKSTESAGWQRALWLVGLTGATTLGVFSKESGVVILGLIILYEATWWTEREQLRGLLLGCAALAPPFLLLLYQRSVVLTSEPPLLSLTTDNPIIAASFFRGRLTALVVMAKCLGLMVWPARLSADYSYNQIPIATGALHDWIAWGALFVVIIATLLAFKRSREAFFFAGFGFVSFIPVSNLLFSTGTIMAERLLYLPAIGFAGCLVLIAFWAGRSVRWEALAPVVLSAMLIALGLRTWERNRDWRDELSLWNSAVAAAPNSFKVHLNLAAAISNLDPAHWDTQRAGQIIAETERALAILAPLPDSMNSEMAYAFAGKAYLLQGDSLPRPAGNGQTTMTPESRRAYERSVEVLSKGLAIDTAFNAAYRQEQLARGRTDSEIPPAGLATLYYAIASADFRLQKYGEAVSAASYATTLDPNSPDAYVAMGDALFAENQREDAAIAFMEGLLISGDHTFLPLLRGAYTSGLDAKGCAYTGGSEFPNPSCELVHSDFCKASSRLIKVLQAGGRQSVAAEVQDQAVQQTGCSLEELR